ncbi:MAG: hypothetical protein JKZ02_00630 [Erythrobacter sp.]|nr:hypothetical protein [Erythrobacter sp.]
MPSAPTINITADKQVPFDDTIPEMAVDYSDASALMQVRYEPGDSGDPVLELSTTLAGGEGIVIAYDAGYADPEGINPPGATIIQLLLNEATLEAMAGAANTSEDAVYHYDIHLTPSGGKKFIFCRGKFIVSPGVTQ